MTASSGRLVFRMGDAFPSGDPVAVFLVSLSTALNDLLTTRKWLVGGDQEEPFTNDVSDAERLYLLRLSFAQVCEVRESIKHARRRPEVEKLIATLPKTARDHLAAVQDVNTDGAHWISAAMTHVRNQTFHYGGKWNWEDLEWAMSVVADEEGEIEMLNPKLVGMRLKLADLVTIQHLCRRFPEYAVDPTADLPPEVIEERIHTLFIATRKATSSAVNFAAAALEAYLDTLPDTVVRAES